MSAPRSTVSRNPGAWLSGFLVVAGITMLALPGAGADVAAPVPGSQGTDTSLPATASQVTVKGRDAFSDLAITVNQTAELTNQAVSITWTGGVPTRQAPGRFGAHFLQIMQCWGEDDGTVPGNPGPPPEQCVQGAVSGTYGGLPNAPLPAAFGSTRVISRSNWANFDPEVGVLDTRTTNVWLPFSAVDGTTVDIQTDPTFNPSVVGGNFWLNPYFNIITTNENPGASTGTDGHGAELFEVTTGLQSSGLGCGRKVQPAADGTKKVPKCWLVIVPRSTPAVENVGTPFEQSADQFGVVTSPVSPSAWKNRIAIPLDFKPVDSPCALSDVERRIVGSELILPAVASWQPALCSGGSLPPYSYATVSDAAARQQLAASQPGSPGMVVVSRPLPKASADVKSPTVYAPVSVSGLAIGFNIERNPTYDAPEAAQQLSGVRIAELNLSPRLVAKLLTQSYSGQVSIGGATPTGYSWVAENPSHLGLDEDFLRFNPEFSMLQIQDTRTFGGLQLPAGTSDGAQQVWEWILADPEAEAWLSGEPDEWGMKVNPMFATDGTKNPTGLGFGDPVPTTFPKADPFCYQAPPTGPTNSVTVPPLCGTDWMPYNRGYNEGARIARVAFDGARVSMNPFPISSSDVWKRDVPQYIGRRGMLTLTDTPSAARFGVQMARLSRAGDNGATRTFIAPDSAGLLAGVASMSPGTDPTVLEPSTAAASSSAYPLTSISYAAIKPLSLDAQARAEYAAFIDYAAGPGQVSGPGLGQLPAGYVALPHDLQSAATTAANLVRTMQPVPNEPTTTTVPSVTTTPPAGPLVTPSIAAPVLEQDTSATPQQASPRPGGTSTNGNSPSSIAPPAESVQPVATPVPTSDAPTTTVATSSSVSVSPTTTIPSALTPATPLANGRFAVAGMGALALGSALGALQVTKRPRRATFSPADLTDLEYLDAL